MPLPDRSARARSLRLRVEAALRASGMPVRPRRRRPDDPGSAAAPVEPSPAPRPLIGGAAAEVD